MATTTILDIVKISELQVVNRLTDKDYLIVNDVQADDNVESKTIVIDDLVVSIGERLSIKQLNDVANRNPATGQILKWNGVQWEPADESKGNLQLSDFAVYNDPVAEGGGRLAYNDQQGVFTYHPADVFGPLSNHGNVSGQTPDDRDVLTYNASSGQWYPAAGLDLVLTQRPPAGGGSLTLEGNRLTYTPPYLGDFITEDLVESDPIFRASPAADIAYADITRWNTAHSWGDHAEAGYMKDARLNDLVDVNVSNAFDRSLLKYNAGTKSWYPGTSVVEKLGDIENVVVGGVQTGDVIKWNNTAKVWASEPNRLNTLSDVNTDELSDGSILVWNGTEWITPNRYFITEVVAGSGLSGGGKATGSNKGVVKVDINPGKGLAITDDVVYVKEGDGLYVNNNNQLVVNPGLGLGADHRGVFVRPGKAVYVNDDHVNVNEGAGLYIDTATNELKVSPGAGIGSDPNGVYAKAGNAIDTTGDKINVREGNGLYIDDDNRLVVNPGLGLSADHRGVFVNPGHAIDVHRDRVDVRVGPGITINADNRLEVTTPNRPAGRAIDFNGGSINVREGNGLYIDGANKLVVNPGLGLGADHRGVFVRPGKAVYVTDDHVNVNEGAGLYIEPTANELRVNPGLGLGADANGVFVRPGKAVYVTDDHVNVNEGAGLYIDTATNELKVSPGAGIGSDANGVYAKAGNAINTIGDKINVNEGDGLYVEPGRNELRVNPGLGLGADRNGVFVRPGKAVYVTDDHVNVNEGAGLYIEPTANELRVNPGLGLGADQNGVFVRPGKAVYVTDDHVNVNEGAGLYIDTRTNELKVSPGAGIGSDANGVYAKAGTAIDTSGDRINVRIDNRTIRVNSQNELVSQSLSNGRSVWGVANTSGSRIQSGSNDWVATRVGYGRVKISLNDRSNLRNCAVLVSDYDEEGDHLSGCWGTPGISHGCDPHEVIIYSRDLENLRTRQAQALLEAIRSGEDELPEIFGSSFNGWGPLDDSTAGISFQIIFPD